jgi:ribonucleoside-triphosphate reductase
MNECLLNFIGEDIGSKKGKQFALKIMNFMRDKLVDYQEETGNLYNLEATPAEGTATRLALMDRENYPDIITAGTKESPYYTNSTQLPVNYSDDLFEVLEAQDELQSLYTGGTVLHLFLGERIKDINMAKKIVRTVFEKFHLPYITLSPTFSICPIHGYIPGEHEFCPKCTVKQPCEVYSRVVGFLRPVNHWNSGKQQEFKERKTFKVKV